MGAHPVAALALAALLAGCASGPVVSSEEVRTNGALVHQAIELPPGGHVLVVRYATVAPDYEVELAVDQMAGDGRLFEAWGGLYGNGTMLGSAGLVHMSGADGSSVPVHAQAAGQGGTVRVPTPALGEPSSGRAVQTRGPVQDLALSGHLGFRPSYGVLVHVADGLASAEAHLYARGTELDVLVLPGTDGFARWVEDFPAAAGARVAGTAAAVELERREVACERGELAWFLFMPPWHLRHVPDVGVRDALAAKAWAEAPDGTRTEVRLGSFASWAAPAGTWAFHVEAFLQPVQSDPPIMAGACLPEAFVSGRAA